MKVSEIPIGEIFTIEETPSYPKLRTEFGYIDMRDLIKSTQTHWEGCRVMTNQELIDQFPELKTEADVADWKSYVLERVR